MSLMYNDQKIILKYQSVKQDPQYQITAKFVSINATQLFLWLQILMNLVYI